jgi:hypothetical protein
MIPLAAQQDFSGRWEFVPAESRNIGMMGGMKLVATIRQTAQEMIVSNLSSFNGREQSSDIRFDLTGKPVQNKNPMEAVAETISKWDGKELVTTWTSPGSVAGSTSVRVETRVLSSDGKTLTVESRRGKQPPMIMVYERR